MNETIQSIFGEYGIQSGHTSLSLQSLTDADSRYLKDLKLNLAAVFKSSHFTKKEAFLLALAVSINEKCNVAIDSFEQLAIKEGASETEVAEIHACVSIMNANNVLYRFRHYLPNVSYYQSTSAGIRMSVMMSPVLGKLFFELVSLVVSALNNCEMCITSHEASVKQHGGTEAKIFDAIRLGSVVKSFVVLL